MGSTLICTSCLQPILRTELMREDMHTHCYQRVHGRKLEEARDDLLKALVKAALPLEVLTAQILHSYSELSGDVQDQIVRATMLIREMVKKYGPSPDSTP